MTDAIAGTIGYDSAFLDRPVPMPAPRESGDLRELAYAHFSVTLDAQRRLAAVTAVNIDGAALHDLARTGGWELDPRVPASEQAGPAVYADNDLDRGHLVRRRDPGWGTTAEAREAMEATFTYPNAAPQASVFNQSKELWLGLEDHVLQFAEAEDLRISVFTAPVLEKDDPPYRGIRIPRRFWKVAAWVTSGSVLSAAGFVLDQAELIDTSRARAVASPLLSGFRAFQVPIRDIADLAEVDFGVLVGADVLETVGARPSEWRELTVARDIVL
jgi:endonuclease G, mitochondrial